MKIISALISITLFASGILAQEVPASKPDATLDLATNDGVKLVNGQWKYS